MSLRLRHRLIGNNSRLIAAFALAATAAFGQTPHRALDNVYASESEHALRLTNLPDEAGFKLLVGELQSVPRLHSAPPLATDDRDAGRLEARVRAFRTLIDRTALAHGLSPVLVHAVVAAESRYDPAAVSRKGAVGLMQLMAATARRFGVTDRTDPAQNVTGGVKYLRLLLDQFGDLDLALAAYNAGEANVLRHGRAIPPFAETRAYVAAVHDWVRRLGKHFGD